VLIYPLKHSHPVKKSEVFVFPLGDWFGNRFWCIFDGDLVWTIIGVWDG